MEMTEEAEPTITRPMMQRSATTPTSTVEVGSCRKPVRSPDRADGDGAEGARVALLVDELLGQQQVVVKNLEANYRKVQDVSGATIMGDGRVALILDTGSLVRRTRH